jgi:hypothetical protein
MNAKPLCRFHLDKLVLHPSAPQCARQCNSQGLKQAFSINETGKLLHRHLAHFVAAIDQIDFTRKLRLAEHQRTCCAAKPRRFFQVDRIVKNQ